MNHRRALLPWITNNLFTQDLTTGYSDRIQKKGSSARIHRQALLVGLATVSSARICQQAILPVFTNSSSARIHQQALLLECTNRHFCQNSPTGSLACIYQQALLPRFTKKLFYQQFIPTVPALSQARGGSRLETEPGKIHRERTVLYIPQKCCLPRKLELMRHQRPVLRRHQTPAIMRRILPDP